MREPYMPPDDYRREYPWRVIVIIGLGVALIVLIVLTA